MENRSKRFFNKLSPVGFLELYIYIHISIYFTKTHSWVEWTAASISLSQTKSNDKNLNDRIKQ